MRSMNLTEEEFTNLKILDMLRAFLFEYQFNKKSLNYKGKKKNKDHFNINDIKLSN